MNRDGMVVIVDLDGTLVQCDDRLQYIKDPRTGQMLPRELRRWDLFHSAGAESPIFQDMKIMMVILDHYGVYIHIITGRPEQFRGMTVKWLRDHGIPYHDMTMRGDTDFRSDVEYKGEAFQRYHPREVLTIMEDRDNVVHMARVSGYTVYQVRGGAF